MTPGYTLENPDRLTHSFAPPLTLNFEDVKRGWLNPGAVPVGDTLFFLCGVYEAIKLLATSLSLDEQKFFETFVIGIGDRRTFEWFPITTFGPVSFTRLSFPGPTGEPWNSTHCIVPAVVRANYNSLQRNNVPSAPLVELQGLSLGAYIFNKAKLVKMAERKGWALRDAPRLLAEERGQFYRTIIRVD